MAKSTYSYSFRLSAMSEIPSRHFTFIKAFKTVEKNVERVNIGKEKKGKYSEDVEVEGCL